MADSAYSDEINFYKPEKRFIIPIDTFHIPKKLFNQYKKCNYSFTINLRFKSVIENCSKPRKENPDTWINQIIKDTYLNLFQEGFAKSIECFCENILIGGLYGVHINGCFFGESMFNEKSNASKYCLLYLISILKKNNFKLLDSQFYNSHLIQFGAFEILDKEYQCKLQNAIINDCNFPNFFNFQKSISVLQSLIQRS